MIGEVMPGFWSLMVSSVNANTFLLAIIALTALTYVFREWRLTRKLSLDDRIARRDGYAAQVASLQQENRSLRTEMDERDAHHQQRIHDVEEKYDNYRRLCEKNEEQHRNEIRALHDQLTGFKRAMAASELAAIRSIPEEHRPAAAAAAAERLAAYLEGTRFSVAEYADFILSGGTIDRKEQ